ncbi:hypothetical protein GCM10010123_22610 [Pilimelia anulata]|uniref:Lipoprotein n=1 Tax=Pilimelia anulata TaxID=53371 RepID=A0A8J3BAL3_9ACTN|nr:hypothetical protein [Pilimelia anulata]GGJ92271.1 hypothetical protein GCM10010123_22610 [Pilimelia anulata]
MRTGVTRYLSSTAAALLLAATGCDSPGHQTSPSAATRPPTATSQPVPSAAASEFPELRIPDGINLVVPVTHGTAAVDTPRFTVAEMKYTLYVACTGSGKLSVDNLDTKAFPCDGVVDRHRVTTEDKTHVVTIRPRGSVRWSVAVGDGDDFDVVTPAPSDEEVPS